LTFEGELTGGRGWVSRVKSGKVIAGEVRQRAIELLIEWSDSVGASVLYRGGLISGQWVFETLPGTGLQRVVP
jgi:hypothetical protein